MELLAPNGKPSKLTAEQYRLVRTSAFKKWFGDWENDAENSSKVVDDNGEPLMVYHRTNKKFTTFDKNKLGQTSGWETAYFGFYFSNQNEKGSYGKKIIKCFLNIRNPYFIETETYSDFDYDYKKFNASNFNKNDGIYIKIRRLVFDEKSNKHFVAFEPNQIKLADGTNTTFDANNQDIRYKDGGNLTDGLSLVIKDVNEQNKYKGNYKKIFDLIEAETVFYSPYGTSKEEIKGNNFYITITPKPENEIIEKISKLKNVEVINTKFKIGGATTVFTYTIGGL